MTTIAMQHYDTIAHRLVAQFGDPAGDNWPEGFIDYITEKCVNIDQMAGVVRWEFVDGSAIVEIEGFWDYGIHAHNLHYAEHLLDGAGDTDPLFIWPECHDVITPDMQA